MMNQPESNHAIRHKTKYDGQPGDGEELDQKKQLGMYKARVLR